LLPWSQQAPASLPAVQRVLLRALALLVAADAVALQAGVAAALASAAPLRPASMALGQLAEVFALAEQRLALHVLQLLAASLPAALKLGQQVASSR
jgi:hypothetical protein